MSRLYNFELKDIDLNPVHLNQYKGKTLLIVNVASKCGYTPQYADLQSLYNEYNHRGLEILAFPCNQFGNQEPGTRQDIKSFCDLNFNVTFKIFDKVDVNGSNASPVFDFLKKQSPGIMGTEAIKWNFTKFVIDKSGKSVKRFAPKDGKTKIESYLRDIL